MPDDTPPPNLVTPGAVSNLTDGTGVSKMLASKIVKDLVLDALLSIPISLMAINLLSLDSAIAAPMTAAMAVGEALIRVAYRFLLRWAQTPS